MPDETEKPEEFPKFERVMIFSAHPDDPEFGAAGTLARLAAEGSCVNVVICTDGSEGGEDPAVPDAELSAQRYEEQRAASRALGLNECLFLGQPDGRLTPSLEFRREITREIRKFRPDLVLTHYPTYNLDTGIGGYHPDHLAVGQATLAAVYPAARNPRAFRELLEEGLEPWKVREVWIPTWTSGDYFVDITSTIDRKIAALEAHKSQFTGWENWQEEIRKRSHEAGEKAGYEFAEGFKRIKIF
ncbi:MAG: PIG-L family deacetylase [Chloroflexi bacterium]|nr:MAG: PIG-L family deacetylase [Chloroflexota bacterium]TME14137.1 MAG: PIG-L family deacetylase [Chloroflexota bacterium]TME18309.1 MAG: PIG-L family deacetylase [Chloroflexota bacterium]